ncbi:MAG: polysaccharide deacetylase family protein [Methanomassiliicoccales archaeon]|nr:MAG: polysaccharide deacetylase family protein [Methanomassiliicoccales archaeon]
MKKVILSVDVDHFPKSEVGISRILELLDNKGIKAPFFIAGKFAEENESVVKEIHTKGHEIGCHGYSHGLDLDENFVELDLVAQRRRIEKTSIILKEITGHDPKIFRAPYAKANHLTIRALEELGYECDSSVTSLRFDFGFGVSNNVKAFFAPTGPYNPSKHNIFKKGDSKVLEVPISAFCVPLTLSAIRTLGAKKVCYLYNLSSRFFDPVVFYLHPWEVMENDEIPLWDGLPRRHQKNRGKEALSGLNFFIDHVGKKSEFIGYKDILGGRIRP